MTRAIRVLYLENEADTILLVERTLKLAQRDYRLITAHSAQDALRLATRHPFDVVIASYQLRAHEQTGSEFLQDLISQGYAIPLILTSTQQHTSFDKSTRELIHQGRFLYIDKHHITCGQLEETLDYLLGQKLSVLCIDDDPEDADLCRRLLDEAEPYRFRFHAVRDITEARTLIAERHWEIILIDWVLDPANGDTAEGALDELLHAAPDSALVVLSGYPSDYLSEFAIRSFGRRTISWCSKRKLNSAKLLQAIMAQRYRLTSQVSIPDMH